MQEKILLTVFIHFVTLLVFMLIFILINLLFGQPIRLLVLFWLVSENSILELISSLS